MRDFVVEISWNHKGTRYEKKSFEKVKASSLSGAVRAATEEAKRKHPDSLRVVPGERILIAVTLIGQAAIR